MEPKTQDNEADDANETGTPSWRNQPRNWPRIIISGLAIVGGIIWAIAELNARTRWVVLGVVPVPWFLVAVGALGLVGEAIKKPLK